jgi:transposase-like protein
LTLRGVKSSLQYGVKSSLQFTKVAADLKLVYGSVTEDEALGALSDFDLKWGKQYPYIAKS